MKLASLAFFLLLFHAHEAGDPDSLLGKPLSLFRDGEQRWLGHALFASLLVVGLLYTRALARSRRGTEAAVAGFAVLLLLFVAATPSWAALHELCALVLLLLLFSYYALLLYQAESFWLAAHLMVPAVLVLATGLHSYGAWQKSFIVYFVVIAVIHHHVLGQPRTKDKSSPSGSLGWRRGGQPMKRRRVYRLDPGREWTRRDRAST